MKCAAGRGGDGACVGEEGVIGLRNPRVPSRSVFAVRLLTTFRECRRERKCRLRMVPAGTVPARSRAARSNIRRPRHSTVDRVLAGFRVSSIPRIDYFRVGRADRRWLRLRLRCRTDASSSHAAPSLFSNTGCTRRSSTWRMRVVIVSTVCAGNTHCTNNTFSFQNFSLCPIER